MHLEGLVADLHAFEQLLLDIGRRPRINRFFGGAAERLARDDRIDTAPKATVATPLSAVSQPGCSVEQGEHLATQVRAFPSSTS
jgi:hypothetical protein